MGSCTTILLGKYCVPCYYFRKIGGLPIKVANGLLEENHKKKGLAMLKLGGQNAEILHKSKLVFAIVLGTWE